MYFVACQKCILRGEKIVLRNLIYCGWSNILAYLHYFFHSIHPHPTQWQGIGQQEYSEQLNIFYSLTLSLQEVKLRYFEKSPWHHFFKKKNWSIAYLQYCVSFRYTYKSLSFIYLFFQIISIIGYCKILNIIPFAIQYLLTSNLSYA